MGLCMPRHYSAEGRGGARRFTDGGGRGRNSHAKAQRAQRKGRGRSSEGERDPGSGGWSEAHAAIAMWASRKAEGWDLFCVPCGPATAGREVFFGRRQELTGWTGLLRTGWSTCHFGGSGFHPVNPAGGPEAVERVHASPLRDGKNLTQRRKGRKGRQGGQFLRRRDLRDQWDLMALAVIASWRFA
jgi:hypothetical protein